MQRLFFRTAIGAAMAAIGGAAAAQAVLKEVTITANPLGASELVAPTEQLSGPRLLLRSQSTLGETLNGLPGVSSTYFGPTASRPVIRGLDGDRVRVLNNSGASLDASSLSYDHAVAADPITVQSIEVLRGPGALLYGGNAIGGVVNLIDNRIPREPAPGVAGKADAGWASGARERSGAVLVEGGNQRIGLHVDAFGRSHGEVRVPRSLECTQEGSMRIAQRLCNSTAQADGGAAGGSVFFGNGYLGASASTFGSTYGAAAEDEVTIRMRSEQLALEGEVRDLPGPVRSVKGRLGHTKYRHTEFDEGIAGTLFRNRGTDLRLEARHAPLGPLQGALGLQAENARFSADGEEAFAPHSRTRQRALFLYEEWATDWGKLTFGGRSERVEVASLGSPGADRFDIGQRRFSPRSAALGLLWNAAPQLQLTGNVAHSERAPKDYELFANGPHVATGAFERGNPALGKERSAHFELGAQWKRGTDLVRVSVFRTRFGNYIALLPTGGFRDEEGNAVDAACGADCADERLPELAYQGVGARFSGLEANGVRRLYERVGVLDLEWRGDMVRAINLDTGEPMPRIAPLRLGATLAYSRGPWSARLGFDRHARQDRVPDGATATDGFTLWHAALSYRQDVRRGELLWYARLDNAADRLAYSATSILTQTAPGRVPLPGRSVKVGVRASF